MSEDKEKRYLYIDGQKVPVSEQIYKTYWEYTEKERYFMGKPKQETFLYTLKNSGTSSRASSRS